MLKSLSQARESPVSSPRFHYASASRSTPSSPSSRRSSKSTQPQALAVLPKPPPKVQYADASTQWSPRTIVTAAESSPGHPARMDADPVPPQPLREPPAPPALAARLSANPPPPPAAAAAAPGSLQALPKPESPAKRRQSRVGSSTSITRQAVAAKRVKPDQGSVKLLPARYEFCEVEDLVFLIANMISELIQTNDSLPIRDKVLTRFHSRTPPGISVLDYLQRLAKHATLTPPLLLSMVYYIDRLCALYDAFTINTLTVHRFLIAAATVAAKGLSDSFWNNATYARVGGIKVAELGLLELEFLYRVDWKIVPNPETLVDYYRGLVERAEGYEIEDDDSSLTDDDSDSDIEGDSEEAKSDAAKSEAETNTSWKELMQNASTKKHEESMRADSGQASGSQS